MSFDLSADPRGVAGFIRDAHARLRIALRDVIGHAESLSSPHHHERVGRCGRGRSAAHLGGQGLLHERRRWVPGAVEVDGVVQIYVRSFPEGANKVRASTGGARWRALRQPFWWPSS